MSVSLPASSSDLASTTMVSFFRWDLGMAREACKRSFFAFNRACYERERGLIERRED